MPRTPLALALLTLALLAPQVAEAKYRLPTAPELLGKSSLIVVGEVEAVGERHYTVKITQQIGGPALGPPLPSRSTRTARASRRSAARAWRRASPPRPRPSRSSRSCSRPTGAAIGSSVTTRRPSSDPTRSSRPSRPALPMQPRSQSTRPARTSPTQGWLSCCPQVVPAQRNSLKRSLSKAARSCHSPARTRGTQSGLAIRARPTATRSASPFVIRSRAPLGSRTTSRSSP